MGLDHALTVLESISRNKINLKEKTISFFASARSDLCCTKSAWSWDAMAPLQTNRINENLKCSTYPKRTYSTNTGRIPLGEWPSRSKRLHQNRWRFGHKGQKVWLSDVGDEDGGDDVNGTCVIDVNGVYILKVFCSFEHRSKSRATQLEHASLNANI